MASRRLNVEKHPIWARYAVAVVATGLGWLLREALITAIGHERLPFIFFFPAIAISAWYGGLGPALLAMVLGALFADLSYIGVWTVGPRTAYDAAAMGGYLFSCAFIITAIELMHRAHKRLLVEVNEREKAQTALTEERDVLTTTLHSIGDAVIATDTNARITFINPEAARLTEWPGAEAVGKPVTAIFKIINEQNRQPVENPVNVVLRNGKVVGLANHTLLISRTGKVTPIDDSAAPIRGPDGAVSGAIMVFRDFSEKQLAQRTSARLAAIVEFSGDAILAKNLDGVVQSWNAAAQRLFGYTAEEIVGKPVTMLFPKERLSEEDHILSRLRQGQAVERFETVRVAKNGRRIPVSVSISPIKDKHGVVIGASKIIHDITEREQIQREQQTLYDLVQAVNQARALPDIYQAALSAIMQCLQADRSSILFLEPDGAMRFKAWRGLSTEYRNAVEGHSPWPANQHDAQPVCINDARESAEQFRPVFEREGIQALAFIPISYNGKLLGKFMVYYNQPHHFTDNELRLGLTVSSQVALAVQRRRAEEELESLVRVRTAKLREMMAELQHVSYAITHDMRAPLRAMSTFAGIIMDEVSQEPNPSPELMDAGRRIIASASRLDQLIQDALNYTKAVLQELPLHPVDLAQLIPSLIESYPNLQAEKADIRIEDPLPVVLGEESLLTQCFSNLLGNAVKFVAPGTRPQVNIRVASSEDVVRVTIQDNGIGIPRESQRRLFGMFERLTTGYEGTGIGLAIVRKVVERMGGKVGVESATGQGSSFWVELRAAPLPTPDHQHTLARVNP
jgi:PAS domain S-box-containing protein